MRKVIIDDRSLLKILQDKEKLQKEINIKVEKFKNLTKKVDELKVVLDKAQEEYATEYHRVEAEVKQIDEDMKPYLVKIERYKDKINPIIANKGIEMGEFEVATATKIEKGQVVVEIEDKVEIYKETLRKQLNDLRGNKKNTGDESK